MVLRYWLYRTKITGLSMSITERYVRADAAGGGDGTTDANSGANGAFTWAEMITDLNTPRVGYRYNVKQGTYTLAATTTLTGDGTTTSPNIIRGFKDTPGDATLGRTTGGALNTANMPTIAYNSTFRFNATGSTNLLIESLNFTGSVASSLVRINTESSLINCPVSNSSNSASAIGVECDHVTCSVMNCDVLLLSGVAGSKAITTPGVTIANRIKNAGGIGIEAIAAPLTKSNLIFESGIGIQTSSGTSRQEIHNNTIVNCSGDGIDFVTGTTAQQRLIGNHITGCGGYGIDFNTSTCVKLLMNNRFRDNALGNINGGGDYSTATNQLNVTSDDTDSVDFVDQSADDYALKATAPAYKTGLSYLSSIGANGSPASDGGMVRQPGMSGGFLG